MSDPSDGGAVPLIQISTTETEIDKGKRPIFDTQLGKVGEGTSGTDKEISPKEVSKRVGQCVPKSKTVPKLQIKSSRIREDINYMKERALVGKFVGIWPTKKTLMSRINTT